MRFVHIGVLIFPLVWLTGRPCLAQSDLSPPTLLPCFRQAASDYHVPLDLLLVLGQMGSGFENRGTAPTIEGGYGLMALRMNRWGGDSLQLAGRLLGVDVERLKVDAALNVRGAAAVLSVYADDARVDRQAGVEAWEPVIVRYAGLDAESSRLFANEVFDKLASGFTATNRGGETFRVDPRPVERAVAIPAGSVVLFSAEYPPATWDSAAACNYMAIDTGKDCVVIHMAEGTAAGVRAWFKDCGSATSAQYVVSETGTVWQMVREVHVAWHAGCYNTRGIGIVHEGFSASISHPAELYQASATLCRYLCEKWGIPIRRSADGDSGILGHSDTVGLCGGDASDPGVGWDWVDYLHRVAGDSGGPRIVSAVSRKNHRGGGTYDIDVAAAGAIECRLGGPTRLVVSFDAPVVCAAGEASQCVSVSSGSVTAVEIDAAELVIDLNRTDNPSRLSVTFLNLVGPEGQAIVGSLCFGVLDADANGDGIVTVADYDTVRDAIGCFTCADRLRCDLNVDGRVDTSDFIVVRCRMGRSLQDTCP